MGLPAHGCLSECGGTLVADDSPIVDLVEDADLVLEPVAGLTIRVAAALGSGPTQLAAFDAALRATGVADFNLVRLSSIIPPHSTMITSESAIDIVGECGDRLY